MSEKMTKDARQSVRYNSIQYEALKRHGWTIQSLLDWAIDEKLNESTSLESFRSKLSGEYFDNFVKECKKLMELGFKNSELENSENISETVKHELLTSYINSRQKEAYIDFSGKAHKGAFVKISFDL